MILLQFPLCTSILTFAPQFWHYTPSCKKRLLWRGKIKKRLPKFFWRLRDTYKKYILQKNWSKTAIPALSSGPSNLQQSWTPPHGMLVMTVMIMMMITSEQGTFLILSQIYFHHKDQFTTYSKPSESDFIKLPCQKWQSKIKSRIKDQGLRIKD